MSEKSGIIPERDSRGAILWTKIPGFINWLKKVAPSFTNSELHKEILVKYNIDASNATLTTLRLRWKCAMLKETRVRAFKVRDQIIKEKNEEGEVKITPEEKLEQDLLRQQVQRLTSRQLFYDVVGQKILTSLHSLSPITPAIIKKQPKFKESLHEESMVLLISDVQAGMRVDSKESGGLGSFNSEILLNYIDVLKNAVLRVREYHPNTRNLHIFWLGDIVEGEDIYGGQLREIDANVIQQVMFCWNHFTKFQLDLANEFEEVYCAGVIGNHGRIGKKGEHSPLSNFDYLLYKMWQERLKICKNIKWDVSESWWQVTDVQGWKFLLVHGDDSGQSFAGIPFYAVARHKARYREMFKNVLDEEMDFDFMTIGHHSAAAEFQYIIMNGSWPGGTELSLKKMQMADVPIQKLFAVHEDHGVTWTRNIHLRPLRLSFNRL